MNLQPTVTQALLRDSIRDTLEREVGFDRLRELEREGASDRALWTLLQRQGWLGLPFPGEVGGMGGSLGELAIVVEELSRRAALIPYVETVASALAIAGSAPGAALLPLVLSGEATIAPALFGADDRISGRSATVADGRLTGEKQAVDYADTCSHHLVVANDAAGIVGLFLVRRNDPGVSLAPRPNIGHIPRSAVSYERVAAERCGGQAELDRMVSIGTLLSAVQCVASAEKALEMTLAYTTNRVQFGRPIASFQAVQQECADMATTVEIARFIVHEAAWKLDRPGWSARDLALAKSWAARAAVDVTIMAHQLHGGIGVTEEYDLNFFSRRAKDRALAWMSEREALGIIAGDLERAEAWL